MYSIPQPHPIFDAIVDNEVNSPPIRFYSIGQTDNEARDFRISYGKLMFQTWRIYKSIQESREDNSNQFYVL